MEPNIRVPQAWPLDMLAIPCKNVANVAISNPQAHPNGPRLAYRKQWYGTSGVLNCYSMSAPSIEDSPKTNPQPQVLPKIKSPCICMCVISEYIPTKSGFQSRISTHQRLLTRAIFKFKWTIFQRYNYSGVPVQQYT